MKAYVERKAAPEELIEIVHKEGREGGAWKAYMEYEEDGEYVYTIKTEIPLWVARKILSGKAEELITILKENTRLSVSEIAEALGRSTPNVYRDLKLLEAYNLVVYKREGRKKIPMLNLRKIIIEP